jgi:hypothetical protein
MKGSQPQHTEDEATERELTSTQRKGGSGFIFIIFFFTIFCFYFNKRNDKPLEIHTYKVEGPKFQPGSILVS